MAGWLLPAILAMAAGVSIVVQQALNTTLRTALNSAAWSGFVSYAVGTACMAFVILALRDPAPAFATAARAPWWAWGGGAFGALFIVLAILLMPQLGAASFIALMIAGQMLSSVAFDHVGAFGLAPRPLDMSRAAGVALLIAGVVLIRR